MNHRATKVKFWSLFTSSLSVSSCSNSVSRFSCLLGGKNAQTETFMICEHACGTLSSTVHSDSMWKVRLSPPAAEQNCQ